MGDWGYDVIEAADGLEAYERLTENPPPRIAILDWNMPGMDGVSICQKIKDDKDKPFIYKILLTSRDTTNDLVYALENGAHNFQTKPISPVEIRSHVKVGRRLVESDDKLKEYAKLMEKLANIDPLTNIYNRRFFMENAEKELARSLRYDRSFSLLMMDIDYFKKINDTYGHAGGDKVLKSVTNLCSEALRDSDIIGRIGGEEFAIVLPETNEEKAFEVAERIRTSLSELIITYEGEEIQVTMSIGISSLSNHSKKLDDILKNADDALYQAKGSGRNKSIISQSCLLLD
ncbi:histidine kinase [Candidatus Magnetomorum sp. HK-1]|nr:histidine kinase [Candidatus Magnetomorum sp. HK-1]